MLKNTLKVVNVRISSVHVSLMAVFAALQAILCIFPLTITIGVSGQITLGVIGGPLVGILLGPILGGLSALIGSFIGGFINPAGAIFGFLTVIPPLLGAVGAGCIRVKRGYIAGSIILVLLMIFYAHPFGRQVYIYPWLHIVAMTVAFSPLAIHASSTFTSQKSQKTILGIVVASFIGIMADHIAGSAIAIWYFSPILTPEIWYLAMLVYPIERVIALIIVSVIAAPIYQRLKKAGFIFPEEDISKQALKIKA